MFSYFFKSFYRNHLSLIIRMWSIIFIAALGFIMTLSAIELAYNKIRAESRILLGADIVLEHSQDLTEEQRIAMQEIQDRFGLEYTSILEFDTNLLFGDPDVPELTEIKLISGVFPLFADGVDLSQGIAVSDAVREKLGTGQTIRIAEKDFRVSGTIPAEQIVGFSLFTQGREIWIQNTPGVFDILFSPGARLEYEYLFAVPSETFDAVKAAFEEKKDVLGEWRIRDIENREERITDALGELELFLQVFLLCSTLVTLLSLYFSLETFRLQEKKHYTLFVILGYARYKAAMILFAQILILFHSAFLLALFACWFIFLGLGDIALLQGLTLSVVTLITSYTALICIVCFAGYLSLYKLFFLPIRLLMRSEEVFSNLRQKIIFGCVVFFGIALLALIFSQNVFQAFLLSGGIFAFCIILGGSIFLVYQTLFLGIQKYRKKYFPLYHTLRALIRPRNMTLLISLPLIIIFSVLYFLIVFAFVFLDVTRLETKNPDYFLLNISENSAQTLGEQYGDIDLYDILLARIIAINESSLQTHLGQENPSGEFSREFNLTTHPLPENPFFVGSTLTQRGVSLDEDFAKRLGVELGDRITFLLSGREVTFEIQNLRRAVRDDFGPFFYFQIRSEDVAGLGRNYFATLPSPERDITTLKQDLFHLSPAIQLIDVQNTLGEIERIFRLISQTVGGILIYTLLFVYLLLTVSLRVLSDLRKPEVKILYTLGASKTFSERFLLSEYSFLLLFSALFALILGTCTVSIFLLQSSFFAFEWKFLFAGYAVVGLGVLLLFLPFFPQFFRFSRKI